MRDTVYEVLSGGCLAIVFSESVSSCEVVGQLFLDFDVHVCVENFLCEWREGDSVEGLAYVYGS